MLVDELFSQARGRDRSPGSGSSSASSAADDHALAAEFRAQAAEAQLYKANQELAAIEEMIRKRLL